jgi:hypothetical protein
LWIGYNYFAALACSCNFIPFERGFKWMIQGLKNMQQLLRIWQ